MKKLIEMIESEYGSSFYLKNSLEQVYIISEYSKELLKAINFITKLKNKI